MSKAVLLQRLPLLPHPSKIFCEHLLWALSVYHIRATVYRVLLCVQGKIDLKGKELLDGAETLLIQCHMLAVYDDG
jgi:hypothetical protein